MSLEIRLVDEAVAELEEAAEWYEQQSAGLGLVFLAAVDRAIDAIVRWPDAGTPVEGVADDLRARRTSIARFPYFIAYVVTAEIIVLAVAHERRRPNHWEERSPH